MSNIAEKLHIAALSLLHRISILEELNSSLPIKPLSPWGYAGYLKKLKSTGIANLLSKVFLIIFSLFVTVIAVLSVFFAPTCAFKPFTEFIPWTNFSSRSLQVKILISIRYLSCWLYQFHLIQGVLPFSSLHC